MPMEFTPLAEADLPMLHEWLGRPHVAQWWGPADSVDELREDFLSGGTTRAFIARLDGEAIGFVQCYVVMGSGDGWWEDETDPGARGVDQFLAHPGQLNRGLGRAMVQAFVARLFEDSTVSFVQTDPSPDNPRAIRCYAAAGFEAVGEVLTPDGPALLMRCRRRTERR
ncbi:RimJ/RimL family protein N-acetyltransferase [Pelomonas saccharophila]|uniref:RimJ/RimL family protein N-acetyltransferase n=1 Tax=Roseateles saccharophilus TaxID=304 RepID=A0ABU1YNT5_ROSSA|nr:GNAT family N-acetyltransferase [Roseateles saccharophilus]MDR7269885.1 RimJ/RimL family protein N-acetyltransferase [Roseateles saccharophilus]